MITDAIDAIFYIFKTIYSTFQKGGYICLKGWLVRKECYISREYTSKMKAKLINHSRAMFLWITPYMEILQLFQWALKTNNVHHRRAAMLNVHCKSLGTYGGWEMVVSIWNTRRKKSCIALNPLSTEK